MADKGKDQGEEEEQEHYIAIMQSRHQQNLYKGNLYWSGWAEESSAVKSDIK